MENYYETLLLKSFSGSNEVKRAFRQLAKQYHPDMSGGDRTKYEQVRAAYEALSDEGFRKDYDQRLKHQVVEEKKEAKRERLHCIDITTKLEIILAWSTRHPSFNPSFVNSCLNQLAEGRELTIRQIASVENIIVNFQIDLDRWMGDEERRAVLEKHFQKIEEGSLYE